MNEDKAARYHRLRRRGRTLALAARAAVLLGAAAAGFPPAFLGRLLELAPVSGVAGVAVAAMALGLAVELAAFPFVVFTDYLLDRRFKRSREGVGVWLRAHVLGAGLAVAGWSAAAGLLHVAATIAPERWWILAGVAFLVLGAARAHVAPLLLLPLVGRAKPLGRPELRARLETLARRVGVPGIGVHEWQVGSGSDAANAAVVGLGPARRILVSTTLLAEYGDDEVEVVVAHEMGHHVHGDIWQTLAFDTVVVLVACLVADGVMAPAGGGPGGLAGLPALALTIGVVTVALSPVGKMISRWHERRADAFAIAMTGHRDAFVTGLRRLGAEHLAETRPSRLVEWLFHSHPPLAARMSLARAESAYAWRRRGVRSDA